MAYPKRQKERVSYWTNQISFTRHKIKPLFDASEVLVRQYFNEPATQREADLMAGGSSGVQDEDVVRRTKSGIVYGWIDQSLANMLDRAPVFQVFPENKESAQRIDPNDPNSLTMSGGTGKIANYRYRETNQLRVDERIALDAFLFPYGVAKIGYNIDFDARKQELLQTGVDLELDDPEDENLFLSIGQEVRVSDTHDHRHHIQVHMAILQGQILGLDDAATELVEQTVLDHIEMHKAFMNRKNPAADSNVKFESPYAVRWQPDMFLTDVYSSEGPTDSRWMAFGWELPIEEVQADPNYENTSDLTASRWKDAPKKPDGLDSDGFDVVRGWEVWAKNFPVGRGKFRDLIFTIAEDHDKFLRYEEEWPYDRIDDYPAETLVFQPGLRRWFHKAPLLMAGGDTVQALVNEVLDSYLSIVRKMKNLWLVDPQSGIDTKIMQDMLDAPDGGVVQVPGLIEAGGNSVVPLPFHDIPPEKGELLAILQQMFDRSAGTPQPVQLPGTDTATEASILEKRNTSRENRRSALLSEFQIRKAKKMWQLDTQFRPKKLFLLDKNADKFLEISAEMAKGEYNFTMDVTSHATALAVERSQWMDLLNLFAGLTPVMMQTFGMPPNLPELARRLLVRGFSEKVVEEILPMLETAATQMQAGPLGVEGQGSGTEFADPAAQGAQEAVREGRGVDAGIGPLQRDSFSRSNAPSEGGQAGESVSV